MSPEQAAADPEHLSELIQGRTPEQHGELEALHLRHVHAEHPGTGERASVAYCLRLLFLDRWHLCPRLTRYRTWQGPHGETIDGTNNGSERATGR